MNPPIPGRVAQATDLLEQARSALTSNMRCLNRGKFGMMQRRTAMTMISRINEWLDARGVDAAGKLEGNSEKEEDNEVA